MTDGAQGGSDPGPSRFRPRERFFSSPNQWSWHFPVPEHPGESIPRRVFFQPQPAVDISDNGGDGVTSDISVTEPASALDSFVIGIRNIFTGGRGERGHEPRSREQLRTEGGDGDGEVGGVGHEVGDANDSYSAGAGRSRGGDMEEEEKQTAPASGSQRTPSARADGKYENGGNGEGRDAMSEKEDGEEEGKPEVLERKTFCPVLYPDLLEVTFKFFDRDGNGTVTRDVSEAGVL